MLMRLACAAFRHNGLDNYGKARDEIEAVLAATDPTGFPKDEQERTIASAQRFIATCEAAEAAEIRASFKAMERQGDYFTGDFLATIGRPVW